MGIRDLLTHPSEGKPRFDGPSGTVFFAFFSVTAGVAIFLMSNVAMGSEPRVVSASRPLSTPTHVNAAVNPITQLHTNGAFCLGLRAVMG